MANSSFQYGTPEVPPTCGPAPTPPSLGGFTGNVSSVGDNALGSLERVSTVGMVVPALVTILVGGELQDWTLLVGRNATDAFHQRPNDYADPANVRVWERKR